MLYIFMNDPKEFIIAINIAVYVGESITHTTTTGINTILTIGSGSTASNHLFSNGTYITPVKMTPSDLKNKVFVLRREDEFILITPTEIIYSLQTLQSGSYQTLKSKTSNTYYLVGNSSYETIVSDNFEKYGSIVSYTVDGRTYIRYYDSTDTILEVDSCEYLNDIVYVTLGGKTYFAQRNRQNEFTLQEGTYIGSDSDMLYFSVGNEIFCKDEMTNEITIVYTLEGSFAPPLYFSGTYLTILYTNNQLILYDIVTGEKLNLSHLYAIEGCSLAKNYGRITITVGESVYLTGAFVSNTGSRKLDCVLLNIYDENYSYGVGGGNFLYSYTDTIIRYLPITGENFTLCGNRSVTYT